nr:hypothetical protein [Tanacetum cinerariifolium]
MSSTTLKVSYCHYGCCCWVLKRYQLVQLYPIDSDQSPATSRRHPSSPHHPHLQLRTTSISSSRHHLHCHPVTTITLVPSPRHHYHHHHSTISSQSPIGGAFDVVVAPRGALGLKGAPRGALGSSESPARVPLVCTSIRKAPKGAFGGAEKHQRKCTKGAFGCAETHKDVCGLAGKL